MIKHIGWMAVLLACVALLGSPGCDFFGGNNGGETGFVGEGPGEEGPGQGVPNEGGEEGEGSEEEGEGQGSPGDEGNEGEGEGEDPLPDPGGGDGEGEPADCELNFEEFAQFDTWLMMSDPFSENEVLISATGFGGEVAIVSATINQEDGLGCNGFAEETEVEFDGQSIRFSTQIVDDFTDDVCFIELEGLIDECGQTAIGGGPSDVFHISAHGVATIAEEEFEIGDLLILRVQTPDFPVPELEPCVDEPAALSEQEWTLSSFNFADFGGPSFGDDVIIEISGSGPTLDYADLYSADGFVPFCSGGMPEGSISFDGQALSVRAVFGAVGENAPEGGETCSLEFTGTATECVTLDDDVFPGFEDVQEFVVTIEGTGKWTTSSGEEGEIETLFYQYSEETPLPPELCDEPIAALDDQDAWLVVSSNPIEDGGFEGDPPALEAAGFGSEIEFYEVSDSNGDGRFEVDCFARFPEGELTFDGRTLTFEFSPDDEFAACSASFTGELVSCEPVSPFDVFYLDSVGQLLSFEGEGVASINDASTPLTQMYLARASQE